MSQLSEGIVFGLGNPLLDITCSVDNDFLKKWSLKANDAILADDSHENLYKEVVSQFECKYIAGGSCQNTLRTIQWMLKKTHICTFMGGIGDDEFGKIMANNSHEVGLNTVYRIDADTPTGTCACLISDNNTCRSLVAYLGASQKFDIEHVRNNFGYVEKARIFYTTGYHLAVSTESILLVAKHVHNSDGKLFTMNLSAPYISQVFSKQLLEVLPYVDILFGNETEAAAFAELNGWKTNDIKEIARLTANLKSNRKTGRKVVYTQGAASVLVASTGSSEVLEFSVPVVEESKIVDTIGAGDAFVGGYIAQLVSDKPLETCVESGVYAAQQVIQQIGAHFPKEMTYKSCDK
ncbi:adenosine kinase-like [Oppia nitens]|uniref:adenosine kinase-like n=1 Tax=Oppia nitens TaxID=1686743 RepID=UPI0023DCB6F7|nr:adenosine kinase-like [Oppia nitens]